MASADEAPTISLPHGHKEWPKIKDKLQKLAEKIENDFDALADTIALSPEWGLDRPPMLDVLKKALHDSQYYTTEQFFQDILPYIASKALSVETVFPEKTLKLLFSGMTGGVLLTRHQSCCILALAFFSLLPSSSKHGRQYQHLNLSAILEYGFFKSQQSKCLCLIGYFDRLVKAEFAGDEEFFKRCITIERKVLERELSTKEFWSKSEIPLGPFEIDAAGVIEDSHGSLQVDFANEYIGGGVLQQGNVQEEIRFVINPECLVSLLFCEAMSKYEAILITGAEQFSSYKGYGGNFTYSGPFTDPNILDVKNRCSVSIVAIDAIPAAWLPGGAMYQFKEEAVLREVNKAYCGFSFDAVGDTAGGNTRVPVATGNWGCGAFGGNKELKTLIQWMASSQAGRKMIYYTFRDSKLSERQQKIVECLSEAKVTVGQLYQILAGVEKGMTDDKGVFAYVMEKINPQFNEKSEK